MRYQLFIIALLGAQALSAQSFYDLNEIQVIKIYFAQSDWDYQLDTAKAGAEEYLLADSVVVNDKTFLNCGVKYKGNSSYDAARSKNPLHIELDYDKNADYQGFTDIKLGNGWSDNAMIREPLCYAILQQYMDAPRGNFARVYINDSYYGLMNNAESINKSFLLDRFYSSKFPFVKCNPLSIGAGLGNGPNLQYLGSDPASYSSKYELKSDTGWTDLIQLCDTLSNHFDAFEQLADVDRMLWMLAFNNVLVNLDSYTGTFRQNYYLYRDHNRRWVPVVWDLNMCMGGFSIAGGNAGALTPATMQTMSHTLHKSEQGWPLIFKLLNDPFYNKMYLAHLRTINQENFASGQYKALANQLHELVDPEVQNDPNFLSTYAKFQVSLTENTAGDNSAGTSPGIFPLMDARAAYLQNVLSAAPPAISNIAVTNADNFGDLASIQAVVSNATTVYLGYRQNRADRFLRLQMFDDGAHGDGIAGDGIFGASIPLLSLQVQYYIYAENAQTGAFSPERAEHEFYSIQPTIAAANAGTVIINELLANNTDGIENEQGKNRDWIELYNKSNEVLGLSNLYLSNQATTLDKWNFPSDAIILPQEHLLVWADDLDHELLEHHSNFNLSKSGETLLLSDGTAVFDEVTFGEQTADHSMSRCPDGVGAFRAGQEPTPRAVNLCTSETQETLSAALDVRVMPNPAHGVWVRIESAQPIEQILVYAADGRCILNTVEHQINTVSWPVGVYWLKVFLPGNGFIMRRLVRA